MMLISFTKIMIVSFLLFPMVSSSDDAALSDTKMNCDADTIPIIDISGLFSSNPDEKIATALRIGNACQEIGFFVITNHGIYDRIIHGVWNSTMEFFDLPTEAKLKLTPMSQADYPVTQKCHNLTRNCNPKKKKSVLSLIL